MNIMITLIFLLAIVNLNDGKPTNITILSGAVSAGAVCLDGTPPAYYYSPGSEGGQKNWVVYLQGGGWCVSDDDCLTRSIKDLGSSRQMKQEFYLNGILSGWNKANPDFHNWNRVLVAYCDGGSFSADIPSVDPVTNLSYRGARIFDYVIEELKSIGMSGAENAILGGESAGGLAAILKCDRFRELLHNVPRVKCISDCGYFFRGNKALLPSIQEQYFGSLVKHHQLAQLLPKSCTAKMNPELCIFPENFIEDMQTHLFLVHSQFDWYQLELTVFPNDTDWIACVEGQKQYCKPNLKTVIHEFRKEFLQALPKRDGCMKIGYYIDSCFLHGQVANNDLWNGPPLVKNATITKAFVDWYFGVSAFQEIRYAVDPLYNCTGHVEL